MLDILTPRGQQSLADEQLMAESFSRQTGIDYVQTPKDSEAVCDAVLVRNGRLFGIAETKCRYDIPTVEHFFVEYEGTWLVTYSKLTRNTELADRLFVPLFGILFLVEPQVFLVKRLYDGRTKELLVGMDVKRTTTQKTINGGSAERANAYIDMKGAVQYEL